VMIQRGLRRGFSGWHAPTQVTPNFHSLVDVVT
jgi:hypothetical protein